MAASIRFDQVGIPASASTGARTDGVPGAVVTVTNDSGAPCRCEFVWVPPDDTTVLASLTQNSPSEWEFTPQADRHGSYAIRMIEAEGTDAQTVDTRVFGIRLPGSGLLVPAFNERGDATVSLADTTTRKALAASVSWNNEQNPEGINWAAWWQAQRELYEYVEGLGGTITGYDTAAALRAVAPASGEVERTYGGLTAGDGKGGLWLGITGQPLATYTHDGEFVLVPVGGDGTAAWVRFSDDVLFLSPDALPSVVDDIDIGRHIQTTDGYTWEVVVIGSNVDNVGTVRTGTTKAALRQYDGPINVRWFGAVGDGAADDAAAIQAAVDAAVGGEGVFFPSGVYITSSTLSCSGSNVALRGEGPTSEIRTTANSETILSVSNASNWSICDLYFCGNNTGSGGSPNTDANGEALWFVSCDNVSVKRCRVDKIGTLAGSTASFRFTDCVSVLVEECLFLGESYSYVGADITISSTNCSILNNRSVSNCDSFLAMGPQNTADDTVDAYHLVSGNYVERTDDDVFTVRGCRHGILVNYNPARRKSVVANNIIRGTTWTGIYLQNGEPMETEPAFETGLVLVQGNYIENVGGQGFDGAANGITAGIWCSSFGGATISENIIRKCGFNIAGALRSVEDAPGILLGSNGSWRSECSNNNVSLCSGPGIVASNLAWSVRNVEIHSNQVWKNGDFTTRLPQILIAGVSLSPALENVFVHHNTCETDTDDSALIQIGITNSALIQNVRVEDNTCVSTADTTVTVRGVDWLVSGFDCTGTISRNYIKNCDVGVFVGNLAADRFVDRLQVDGNIVEDCDLAIRMPSFYFASGTVARNCTDVVPVDRFEGETIGVSPGGQRLYQVTSSAIPTGGVWLVGDVVKNDSPSVGNPVYWVCTVAGSPGTWVAGPNL